MKNFGAIAFVACDPPGKILKTMISFPYFHIQDSKGWTLDGNLVTSYQSDEVFSFDKGKQLTHQPLSDATVAGERERGREMQWRSIEQHRSLLAAAANIEGWKCTHTQGTATRAVAPIGTVLPPTMVRHPHIIRPAECHYFNCVSNHVFFLEYVRCDRWKWIRKRAFRPKITKCRHSFGCI